LTEQEYETVWIDLESAIWHRIGHLALRESVTPVVICGTALAVLIARVTDDGSPLRAVVRIAGDPSGRQFQCPGRRIEGSFTDAVRTSMAGVPDTAAQDDPMGGWAIRVTLRPPSSAGAGVILLSADPSHVDAARTRGLLDAYGFVLAAAVMYPETPVEALPVALRHNRARAWPERPPDPASALSDAPRDMATLFTAIARRWPDARAIVWPDGTWTFAELAGRADAVASLLQVHGARAGDVLAFRITTRDPPGATALYLAAQVAAFRLGCAILPLGQQLPAIQARAQIEALGARFVIAAADCDCAPTRVPNGHGEPVPGSPWAVLLADPAKPADAVEEAGTAILFTSSGSTGTPKTIRVTQAMLLGLVSGLAATGAFPALPGLLGPNIGFDAAISDVWLPWASGCHVVLLATERRTPAALAAAVAMGARMASLSPTVVTAALLDDPDAFAGFHSVMLAGEVVPPPLARRLAAVAPHLSVINGYGPTENAVLSTCWVLDEAADLTVPIGFAVPRYRVLIGDSAARPLPPHWPGELLIASAAPARGYRDAAMTKDRFIELSGEPPGPFFRSGDFGWIDEQGRVRFSGRRDRQIKLNGVRIEIDGIEHRIASVAGVADVAVIAVDRAMRTQLIAVVHPKAGTGDLSVFGASILAACRNWLPRAASLSALVFVESMPVSGAGKKSYAALNAMLSDPLRRNWSHGAMMARHVPEPDSIEARLATLWTELLQETDARTQVTFLEDDVFALGASSLDTLRMAERIERTFAIEVTDDQMFLHTTIAAQAAMVRAASARDDARGSDLTLVRSARGPGRTLGAMLGMPLVGGQIHYLGILAANAFADHDIWGFAAEPLAGSMLEDAAAIDCARRIADRLLAPDAPSFQAFIGFSVGGFMAWLVDRMLVAAGRPPTPIINLEGGALHRQLPGWRARTLPFLPVPADGSAARMLLLYRPRAGDITFAESAARAWSDAEGAADLVLDTVPCRTVSHLDFVKPSLFTVYEGTIAAYLAGDSVGPTANLPDIDTPGGLLFTLLEDSAAITVEALGAFMAILPPGPVEVDLRQGVLFLCLACGDIDFARAVCDRLVADAPRLGDAVHAKAALMAAHERRVDTEPSGATALAVRHRLAFDLAADFTLDWQRAMDTAAAFGGRSRGFG
jgi:non-ribosomal peptide synthetase component F/acyl carrier protein